MTKIRTSYIVFFRKSDVTPLGFDRSKIGQLFGHFKIELSLLILVFLMCFWRLLTGAAMYFF